MNLNQKLKIQFFNYFKIFLKKLFLKNKMISPQFIMNFLWISIFLRILNIKTNDIRVRERYCIVEEINVRKFKKVLKGPVNISMVEFELVFIQKKVKIYKRVFFEVLVKKEYDNHKQTLLYFSSHFRRFFEFKNLSMNASLIRYYFTYENDSVHYICESLCSVISRSSSGFSITKEMHLTDKNLKYYLETLIYKAIRNCNKISDNVGLIEQKLKRIRWNELYNPIHFHKVDYTKPFILKFIREPLYLSNFLKKKILRKYIHIFEDYYATSVYKNGMYIDSTKYILEKIKNSQKENELMIKTLCEIVIDIVLITELLFREKRIYQTSLYIDQAHAENLFSFKKCFEILIYEILIIEDLIEDKKFFLILKNNNSVEAEVYLYNRVKFIVLLGDFDYSDVTMININITLTNEQSKNFSVKV